MKKIFGITLIFILIGSSCSDSFLDEVPTGELSPDQILESVNMEGLIISAYAVLNGQFDEASNAYNSPASNWSFGDVVSDDDYKGGGGTGDQNQIHLMEIFNTNPTVMDFERKWLALYEGVKRANVVLRQIDLEVDMDQATIEQRKAEMRFLRGHFYFELKKIYNKIPYIDETAEQAEDYYVSNEEFTSDQLWDKIADDFKAAYDVLPMNQEDPGRPTKLAALSYLCKVYIYKKDWSNAIKAADDVIKENKYTLMPNFRDVFLPENDNGQEIIFAVQNSINDGSPRNYNGSIGDRLAPPGGPRYPQYGFHRPSQNLINAFRTTPSGLPAHENVDVTEFDPLDPRIDHSQARPGIPYLDLGIEYEESWARDLATYGPFSPKKRMVSANSPEYLPVWPYVNSLNYYVIRYADLLLWRAEAAIEEGDLETGRKYINEVRNRAKTSEYVKALDESGDAANYLIDTYNAPFSDKTEALRALRIERRLELAHEGHRFFDLVRWGIAAKTMNDYFEVEKTKRTHLSGAKFVEGTHEYAPIPQSQIDLGRGKIKQNNGYN
ncbi:MAG: RagB/SusD family nutrient uptake outer membrane protein [Cytophagales bacterium]|nr:RagB/SusD family nutrient uptake outer membrane protein [Cytophagales bacterium]